MHGQLTFASIRVLTIPLNSSIDILSWSIYVCVCVLCIVWCKFSLTKCVRKPVNMSEGADSVPSICENSLTTLKVDPEEVDPEKLPPRIISYNTRRPRFGIGNAPLSPYILIDGRKLRSSLAFSKKRPLRRVSFPANDNLLVTGCLEPANPWKLGKGDA